MLFTGGPVSVRLSRSRLQVVNVSDGAKWEGAATISVDENASGKLIVTAVGASAQSARGRKIYPFQHPRVLVSDYTAGEKVLQHAIREVLKRKWFAPAPVVVIQVTEHLEGGVSDIEWRALIEMAQGAGARQVYPVKSGVLSDSEIKLGAYLAGT
jgi:rod shape-determining protein MreB